MMIRDLRRPRKPDRRLVLFPGAGSGPGPYSALLDAAPANWQTSVLCLPGRDQTFGHAFLTSMSAAAQLAVQELAAGLEPGVECIFFGHSMGGLLALLVATQLPPVRLVLAGTAATTPVASTDDPVDLVETEAYLAGLLSARGITDAQDVADLAAIYAPVLAADVELLRSFLLPSDPVPSHILALYGEEDAVPRYPWQRLTTGTATEIFMPGGHFFPLDYPELTMQALLREL